MTALDWILSTTFIVLYFVMIFTVCFLTFQKGHIVLGIIGIFLPILWLIGAVLPAKPGSRYEIQQGIREQAQIEEMTR
jgi:hypothetical protein